MAITQMTRFKSDKAEEMIKNAKNAKTIFEKHGAEFLRLSRFHTGIWAGEWLVVTRYASWEVWQGAGGISEGPGIRKAVGKYSYHCPTDGPQPHRQRRSLTTPWWLPQPTKRVAGGDTPPRARRLF
jgi:hypothetical protein